MHSTERADSSSTAVVTRKAPHDVLRRRLLHVLLQVVEGVLSHDARRRPAAFQKEPEVGSCSPTKALKAVDLLALFRTNDRHAADLRPGQVHVHHRGLSFVGY